MSTLACCQASGRQTGGRAGRKPSVTLGQAAGRVPLAEADQHHALNNLQGGGSKQDCLLVGAGCFSWRPVLPCGCGWIWGLPVSASNADPLLKGQPHPCSGLLAGHQHPPPWRGAGGGGAPRQPPGAGTCPQSSPAWVGSCRQAAQAAQAGTCKDAGPEAKLASRGGAPHT